MHILSKALYIISAVNPYNCKLYINTRTHPKLTISVDEIWGGGSEFSHHVIHITITDKFKNKIGASALPVCPLKFAFGKDLAQQYDASNYKNN